MSMINLPTAQSMVALTCRLTETQEYHVQTSDGWTVAKLSAATPEATASDIARAIEAARDIGYQQCLQHIRRTLGLQE